MHAEFSQALPFSKGVAQVAQVVQTVRSRRRMVPFLFLCAIDSDNRIYCTKAVKIKDSIPKYKR